MHARSVRQKHAGAVGLVGVRAVGLTRAHESGNMARTRESHLGGGGTVVPAQPDCRPPLANPCPCLHKLPCLPLLRTSPGPAPHAQALGFFLRAARARRPLLCPKVRGKSTEPWRCTAYAPSPVSAKAACTLPCVCRGAVHPALCLPSRGAPYGMHNTCALGQGLRLSTGAPIRHTGSCAVSQPPTPCLALPHWPSGFV